LGGRSSADAALTEGYVPEFFTLDFGRKSARRILTVFLVVYSLFLSGLFGFSQLSR
jgi:hypothetical protein